MKWFSFVGPVPQQPPMAAPATPQFIMQPDGTLIPAPQPVQPSPVGIVSPAQVQQQSVMQPVMADPVTQALIAQPMQPVVTTQAQFVDPAQPQVVYQVRRHGRCIDQLTRLALWCILISYFVLSWNAEELLNS